MVCADGVFSQMMGQKSGKIINISSSTAYCFGVLGVRIFHCENQVCKEAGKVRWYRPAGFNNLIITSECLARTIDASTGSRYGSRQKKTRLNFLLI
jgi:hypothetical protein